jgi:beta-galactosidase
VPVALSWRNWEPASWQKVWTYRRRFHLSNDSPQQRFFLTVERAMVSATVRVNGQQVGSHQGGFLPFDCEITNTVRTGASEVEIEVDARWLNIPPAGSPKGPAAVDYYLPGGIPGAVMLRTVPRTAVMDLWARSRDVLSGQPSLDIFADVETDEQQEASFTAQLFSGDHLLQQSTISFTLVPGRKTVSAQLASLRGIALWAPDSPHL